MGWARGQSGERFLALALLVLAFMRHQFMRHRSPLRLPGRTGFATIEARLLEIYL
jgi:hypothetical protein